MPGGFDYGGTKKWAVDEIEFLRANYQAMTTKEIAARLGRTYFSVGNGLINHVLARNTRRYEKHHQTKTSLYRVWWGMKRRCSSKKGDEYKNYGRRGIRVCDEWLNSFIAFYDWAMENGYREGLTIDRINNDGDYCPTNCRWVRRTENTRNNRQTKLNEHSVRLIRRLCLFQRMDRKWIAKVFGVCEKTIDNVCRYQTWKDV